MDSVTSDIAPFDWTTIRQQYPALASGAFLNAGSRGLLSLDAHAAGLAALEADLAMAKGSPPADKQLRDVRTLFGKLIGAPDGSIAVTKNVSEGLNIVATAVDWRPGDNVVLSSDVEHANNVYLWLRLKERGIELRDVPTRDGVIDAEAMAAAIDPRTRIVTASAVTFVPGFRTDLQRIGMAARAQGALFLVDGVQSCGVLAIDVERDRIDALATSTSKGLLGIRGLGFLYVSPRWIERLAPAYIARNSVDTAGKHYSEFEQGSFLLAADATRFEYGNYNYVGIAIARAALSEILAIGVDEIENRSVALATRLADGLHDLGLPVLSPPAGTRRSHLVTLGKRGPGGPDSTGDARLDAFAAALSRANVTFTIRRRLIRFGFHFYNDESDVEAVLAVARSF